MNAALRAYLELLRISNVLTAVADVWMGMIVATGTLAPASVSVPLTLASVLLYLSGMVLNDYCDAEKDARERPTRPIPSGRIAKRTAAILGYGLIAGGLVSAAAAGLAVGNPSPLLLAGCLAYWVVFYNRHKATLLGPLLMAMCRMTNVLLGLSASEVFVNGSGEGKQYAFIAAGHLLYVLGLTLFARHETTENSRAWLTLAASVSIAGLATYAGGAIYLGGALTLAVPKFQWGLLWVVIALLIARRYVAAILQPTPRHIQSAVGNAIQSIILIDAALAWGYAGPFWGLAIFALLPPTMLMARFIPQT